MGIIASARLAGRSVDKVMPKSADITHLLHDAQAGDADAFDAVYKRVYDELHRLARVVRQGRASHTLNTTALVHEAYLKLMPSQGLAWQDRAHFFRVAARAMRQVLMNAARDRVTQKRGGPALTVQLNDQVHATDVTPERLLMFEDALARLETLSVRQARVVECRFFTGLSVEETAQTLGISTPTVKRDWRAARAFLAVALK